jgi:hypothetical protein
MSIPMKAGPMRQPLFYGESSVELVADTSVIINLNATGMAPEILRSLGAVLYVSTVVRDELVADRINGRQDGHLAGELADQGLAVFCDFNAGGEAIFESLVTGSAASTLDDGEAATLALAICSERRAVIDERKANRISADRFPDLSLFSTADLLSCSSVLAALGAEALATGVYNALQHARMAIPESHHQWVLDLLGDKATECRSLPSALRARA